MNTTHNAQTDLPRWDLADLYAGPDDLRIADDIALADADATAFAEYWKGKLATASAADLATAIAVYEQLDERLGRLASYAQLLFAANTSDPAVGRFQATINERLTDISAHTLFFTLELNRIDDSVLDEKLASPELAVWQPFLRDLRVFRPYQLSDEVERVLMEKAVSGRQAWMRLFDETMADMTVTLAGETQPLDIAFNRLTDTDRTRRAEAAQAISASLGAQSRLFTLITNTLAKDKAIGDGMRGYERPASSRNRGNMVEDSVVDALVSAVRDAYPRLSHRYYSLKKSWLGLDKLEHWDRNAPLPGSDDAKIGWDDAKSIVRRAYEEFDPDLGSIAGEFLDKPWIDAAPAPGKSSGAFAHPTVPSAHPYILLNYHGRARDVMTLAHELGHGIHQKLAAQQGYFHSGTPLTLAETASVFGEMLTFRSLLDAESDPARKRFLLASKVEDMLNTVVRQIAFYCFEVRVHDERAKGELSKERLGEIWREVQVESLGPAFNFTPDYDLYWAYIPHFIHSPFYVYAYAFGDCLVNALYGVYREGDPEFVAKYRAMLEAGGTKRHRELLAPFGLDASEPAFWAKGLDVIAGFIDELANESASA